MTGRSGGGRSAKLAGVSTTRRPRGGYYPGDWVRPRPNPGGWTPIADTQEIHTGNRSVNRAGAIVLARSGDGHRWRQVAEVTERDGDQLKAVFEDPTAPPVERYKGMGCDGGWYDADTGARMDTCGEGGANEEAVRRWKAQEYQGPAYRGSTADG